MAVDVTIPEPAEPTPLVCDIRNDVFRRMLYEPLDLACKIAFAEMWLAWMHSSRDIGVCMLLYDECAGKYKCGEVSPELLAEMRRVREELSR